MKKFYFLIATSIFLGVSFSSAQNLLENDYDVKQYILDLQLRNNSTFVQGNVTINATVTAAQLDTFAIELIDTITGSQTYMAVDSIVVNGTLNNFQHHDDLIFVAVNEPIPQNQLFSVRIYYHGNGAANYFFHIKGIYSLNYTNKYHTCTISESRWSKIWWPCKQDLRDKADSVTFYITTDSANLAASNGILKSITYLPDKKVKYEWVTKYPIDYYLISFVIGPMNEYITYAPLPYEPDSVLLQNFLFPNSDLYEMHLNAIEKTKQLIWLYSELLGDYPFKDEKYGYCVVGIPYTGMENQTICTMGYTSLDTTAFYYDDYYNWTTAHELAHQWFGDYVTCATWNDVWLNEGLASYMEYVSLQNLISQAEADIWIRNDQTAVVALPGGSVYIQDSIVNNETELFDARLTYKKGPCIVHILRYEINNDSLFFRVLKNYLSAYAYSVATAEDFKAVAETTAGIDLADFFNEWYYGEGYPIFDITWKQDGDTLAVISNQTTSSPATTLFRTHFDLKIFSPADDTTVRLFQGSNNETYKLYFPGTVDSIKFDPGKWLLQTNAVSEGVPENNIQTLFRVFPNPVHDRVVISADGKVNLKNISLSIYTIQGQLLLIHPSEQEQTELDMSDYRNGIYFLKVGNSDCMKVIKLVKE